MAGMYAEAPAAVGRAYVPGYCSHCGASKHDGTPCEGAEGRDRQWILERVVLLKVTTADDVPDAPRRWLYSNKLVGSIPAEFSALSALSSYAPSACCKVVATVSPLSGSCDHPPTP